MRVLFIYPNTYSDGCMPLGIAMLSAVLKEAGHEIQLFDTTFFNKKSGETNKLGEKHLIFKKTDLDIKLDKSDMKEEFRKAINNFKPDLIAISATSINYSLGLKLLKSINGTVYAEVPVVVGGSHPTVVPDKVVAEDGIDIICIGEGEGAMLELCNRMEAHEDITNIKNLWIKKNGKIFKNGHW